MIADQIVNKNVYAEISKDDVEAFTNYCVTALSIDNHVRHLFDGSESQSKLLYRTAPILFTDLNVALIQNLILHVCKLTDPHMSRGNQNLTTNFFVEKANASIVPRLQSINEKILPFASKLHSARHKLIAHLDRKTIDEGRDMGAVPPDEWQAFWNNLEEFVNVLQKFYCSNNLMITDIGMLSDADSLVKRLEVCDALESGKYA